MNDLMLVEKEVAEVERRAAELATREGRLDVTQRMLEVFGVLETFGYRPPEGNGVHIASSWVAVLEEYIAVYGMDVIKKAVIEFVKTDSRSFKGWPVPSDLIQAIKKVGGKDPRLVKAKLVQQQREEKIIEQWKKESKDYEQRTANRQTN